jgi:hypothetical protein
MTVNQHFYTKVCDKNILRTGALEICFFHHDNGPSHSPLSVQEYLTRNCFTVVHHPLYFPALAPFALFLVPKFKLVIKGKRFDGITIKKINRLHLKSSKHRTSQLLPTMTELLDLLYDDVSELL